jgi:hypothetical protein
LRQLQLQQLLLHQLPKPLLKLRLLLRTLLTLLLLLRPLSTLLRLLLRLLPLLLRPLLSNCCIEKAGLRAGFFTSVALENKMPFSDELNGIGRFLDSPASLAKVLLT